jgi:tetratricopeptide (TPR) repeat protein
VIGAAIGRDFSHELIAAISALAPADLDAALERLAASGLVARRGTPPDATYTFKHALVRDAAYATMLRSRRRELHSSIAKVLVERFPVLAERQPEVVARHFTEGGLASEAIGYWIKASRRAIARSAHREAVMSMEQALLLLEAQPKARETQQQSIDLCFDLKESLVPLGELERIFPRLHEAENLAKMIDDQYRLGRAYTHFCHVYWMTGQTAKALVSGQEARTIAQALGDGTLEMRACLHLGGACVYSGDYRWGEDLLVPLLQSLEANEAFPDADRLRIAVHAYLAVIFGAQGKFRQGIEQGETGMRLAELQNNPQVLANVTVYAAMLAVNQGDSERAIALAERAVALCRQWNLAMQLELAKGLLGRAYALSGRLAESIPMLEEAASAMATMRHVGAPVLNLYLGQTCLAAHRGADALASAQRGLAVAREGGQRGLEARILCLLGDVAAHHDLPDQAESDFRDALALAEACDDRPFVAHCHFGYGKLYRRTGSRTRARKHFATATAMYRDMGMTYWLEQAEAEMRQRH